MTARQGAPSRERLLHGSQGLGQIPHDGSPQLVRGLGAWDGTLLTIGAMVGTGIFITTGDIAKDLPYPGLILLVWIMGGLLTVAGALTYAELGVLFPRAGGMYHFLKEAYGPLPGFLFGWASFLVIMSGGIAAIAVGFGEYLGSFLPWFSTQHVVLRVPVGSWTWTLSGGQVAAAAAILALTAINYIGLKEGAWVQNVLTVLKVGAVAGFAAFGLLVAPKVQASTEALRPAGGVLAAFGVGLIAALWSYDGWYGLVLSAGEVRQPERNVPRGLVWGTAAVLLMYALLNVVYIRALPVEAMAATPRDLRVPRRDDPVRSAHLPADGPGRAVLPCSRRGASALPHSGQVASRTGRMVDAACSVGHLQPALHVRDGRPDRVPRCDRRRGVRAPTNPA
jgi:APA family basic amino acid/polyamine antiporter